MYLIEIARLVGDRFIERFVPSLNAFERWKQANGQVDNVLSRFITPAIPPRGHSMQ